MFRGTTHVYDLIYEASGKDYGAESATLRSVIERHNPSARTLLDVACGTGGHLRHLRQWFDVTGVDLDPEMLRLAGAKLRGIPLVEGDMRTFALDTTFDAIVCLFSSVGYMRSTAELHEAVATIAGHLSRGGVLVVDGWVRPDAWVEGGAAHMEVASGADVKVARVSRSRRHGSTTHLEMHHLVAGAGGIDHIVDHHELTLFTPEQYEAAFRGAGLSVLTADSPMPGRDRYIGIKPA